MCETNNVDIYKVLNENNKRPSRYCANPKCQRDISNLHLDRKYCSQRCAAQHLNSLRGKLSQDTRSNISNGVKQKYQDKNYKKLSELILDGIIINPHNVVYHDRFIKRDIKSNICCVCGKKFPPILMRNEKISKAKTCSRECLSKLKALNSKENALSRIKNGTFIGWKTRNITSYPEKFWMQVLDKNSIKYEREFLVKTTTTHYFLDFKILTLKGDIDLEIDGKQHKRLERIEKDAKRDVELTDLGYHIYRVEWNEINSPKGKDKMKNKINEFLDFYKIMNGGN